MTYKTIIQHNMHTTLTNNITMNNKVLPMSLSSSTRRSPLHVGTPWMGEPGSGSQLGALKAPPSETPWLLVDLSQLRLLQATSD